MTHPHTPCAELLPEEVWIDKLNNVYLDPEIFGYVGRPITKYVRADLVTRPAMTEAMGEALKPLLQQIGDGIADMFEQMLKGNWVDDHGHDVQRNQAMLKLQGVLSSIMDFRVSYLDYDDKHRAALSAVREGKGE